MSNISITDSQLNEMLQKLSLEKIEDLFKHEISKYTKKLLPLVYFCFIYNDIK